MKSKLLYTFFFAFILSLVFIRNIPISGDNRDAVVTREDFFMQKHEGLNDWWMNKKENHPRSSVDFDDFYDLICQMKDHPFYVHRISNLDTNGDGFKEDLHSIVSLSNGSCLIRNYIEKDNRIIWKDEFEINRDYGKLAFQDNDLFNSLEPYALFYLGLVKSKFADRIAGDFRSDDYKKILLRSLKNPEQSRLEIYHSELREKMDNYKGLYLFGMNEGERAIYMWDDELATFIKVHEIRKVQLNA